MPVVVPAETVWNAPWSGSIPVDHVNTAIAAPIMAKNTTTSLPSFADMNRVRTNP